MILFFTFDITILLAFIGVGIVITGFSIKELADFVTEKIYISFPIILALIMAVILVYFFVKRNKLKKYNPKSFKQNKGYKKLKRECIIFSINAPLTIISFLAGIGVVAESISKHGILGFIGGVLFGFLAFIAWIGVCGLFGWSVFTEFDHGEEMDFGIGETVLRSLGIFILQAVLTVFIAMG